MSKQKFHLFFSVKQAKLCLEYGDLHRRYYEKEDGAVVEVTEVIAAYDGEPVPTARLGKDAQYLGIGTYHHLSNWSWSHDNQNNLAI